MAMSETGRGTINGRHVLVGVLSFFAVIFAVNGFFLYSALNTHTGIVSKQPYRKGLDYNQRIAEDEQQKRLGWAHEIHLDRATGRVRLSLSDRHGRPVSGLDIRGFVGRPSTDRHDIALRLAETSKLGSYAAIASSLTKGNWVLQLKATRQDQAGAKIVYRLRKRLWLKH